jgi:hypothetical protein
MLGFAAIEVALILPAAAVCKQETCYRRKLSNLDSQQL